MTRGTQTTRTVTIFGAGGFVGSHLADHLEATGASVRRIGRDDPIPEGNLGEVVYAIGLTADFRSRTPETIEAHASLVAELMARCTFDAWLYLSSTRVYGGLASDAVASEDDSLPVRPSADALYDLSKLLGESVVVGHTAPTSRVARLSNVYGDAMSADSFLGSLLADLEHARPVSIGEHRDSSKDYVAIEDVVQLLDRISAGGRHRIYNVSSGGNTSHAEVAQAIVAGTGRSVDTNTDGALRQFPVCSAQRVQSEFGLTPRSLVEYLPALAQRRILESPTEESA